MKERVDLNNNGLSIESTAYVLQDNKWTHRYVLCKKPTDLNVAVLYVYKNKREKQHNVYKFSRALQNYVGFESGFEYKRRSNTLCIFTEDVVVSLAFERAENLIIWKTWLENTCGKTISFFMQLKRLPLASNHNEALLKEVRCHIHDGRLAVVYGRPQEVIFYCDVFDCAIEVNETHNVITFCPDVNQPTEVFIFLCARSRFFRICIEAARCQGSTQSLISRQQCDGEWLPRAKTSADHSSQFTVNISELASLMRTPEPDTYSRIEPNRLNRQKSKSGFVYSQSKHTNTPLSRANSTAAYYSTMCDPHPVPQQSTEDVSGNYVNLVHKNFVKINSSIEVPQEEPGHSDYYNCGASGSFCDQSNQGATTQTMRASRTCSLPEYVNVQLSQGVAPVTLAKPKERNTSTIAEKIRRRSDNPMAQFAMQPSTSKGNSIPNFSTTAYEADLRHENWRRAKKFFSAFKPKSQSDLLQRKYQSRPNLKKSSSTGALQFASSISYFPCESTESISGPEDLPPSLNMAISEHMGASQPALNENPPEGLIRPKEESYFKGRSGVSAILARRLASSIRGSFSKYDGEKLTHMYQPTPPPPPSVDPDQPPPRPPKSEKFDGITSAVNRGQEKLKMSDRRASNVSFHRVNIGNPLKTDRTEPAADPPNYASQRPFLQHLTSHRNSNSYSDCTRSSNESLSSDARSRISIRKRNNSPPRTMAPLLTTVTRIKLNDVSSLESLNSNNSTRTVSPVPLPKTHDNKSISSQSLQSQLSRRTVTTINVNYCDLAPRQTHSSSSSNSICSRINYVVIDPITTKAAQEATTMQQDPFERSRAKSSSMTGISTYRRQSQGHGSSASDSLSVGQPTRQGFFKKYRKIRRRKKNALSMSQLNI